MHERHTEGSTFGIAPLGQSGGQMTKAWIENQIALSAGKVGPNRLESFHFPTESEQRDLTVQQSAADEPTMTQI